MKQWQSGSFLRPSRRELFTVTALLAALSSPAHAHDSSTNNVTRLPETVVSGRADSLLNIAGSASQGTVGAEQIAARPLQRPGELLETVPGVIITQHSGAGKANQFFSRGFNLDHGTDFATSLGGVPINLPTHGHGQGYTDLNFIIPELVDTIAYKKGPYHASEGDFSSAGAVNLEYADHLENSFLKLEGGSFNHARAVFASSPHVGQGHLLYGIELFHNDGPWDREDNYRKLNGVVRYSQGDEYQGFSITATAYKGDWDATDQISATAIEDGLISRWGTLDPTTGGDSQRHGLSAEWHREDDASATKILAYGYYYDLDLFSNFTYFLDNPVEGDQFEQTDKRGVTGIKASHTLFGTLAERELENTVGVQLRGDFIENGLHNTTGRQRWATTREDNVRQFSLAPYYDNKVQWAEKFRTVAGVRADYYNFHVNSIDDTNSGNEDDIIASPKLSLIFGPWAQTELYLNGGLGFHSNDGRGSTQAVDPVDPLVQTYGAEIGARTTLVPGLHSTLAFWWLDIDSELLFIGDAGNTEASSPSRRYGVELANYYTLTDWLSLDLDVSFSHSEFRDEAPEGDHIPGSIESVVATGFSVHDLNGFFGGVRLRYFGPRPLIEDDSVRSGETILLSAQIGYRFSKTWTIEAEVFNILDRKDSDIEYYYESNTTPIGTASEAIHFHPVEPISARVALTARF